MKRVKHIPYFTTVEIPVMDLMTSEKFHVVYPKAHYGGRGGKQSRTLDNVRRIGDHLVVTEKFYFKPGMRLTVHMPKLHLCEVYLCKPQQTV